MKYLNLHSTGKRDYLKLLKENYNKLVLDLKGDPNLSPAEKEAALRMLSEKYKSERNNAEYNLFSVK